MTKQRKLEIQAQDMVDMAIEWMKLAPNLQVKESAQKQFDLFDAMQIEVLKRYTNIEEKIRDQKADS